MSSSPSVPPPHYSTTGASTSATSALTSDNFFDVVPQSDATSFQVGYLGLDGFQAWIKGDVLIKLDESTRQQRHLYEQCSISLIAVEANQTEVIPFFNATEILWRRQNESSSKSNAQQQPTSSSEFAPSTLPFSFRLTSDLPHCIHLPHSSLEYRLEATLKSSDESLVPSSTRSVMAHLTRYSRPGKLDSSLLSAHTWNIDTPTPMIVRLQQELYRRAEPISVYLNIPPPEKLPSLNLRSVEANLYRVIQGKGKNDRHELLLAHSGKLCRLHSTRSIILRLTLHPPFDSSNMPYPHPDHDAALSGPVYGRGGGGGCESISQETLLHKVSFVVRILIGIRGEEGERRDVVLQREIQVLPGAAGGTDEVYESPTSSKKAEAELSSQMAGPSSRTAGSTSRTQILEDEEEEEYDGYEDVGRPLSSNGSIHESEAVLESLGQEDGPPPTLLESRNDLQVEVEVAGVGPGVPRSPPAAERDYLWVQDADNVVSSSQEEEDGMLPPATPAVEGGDGDVADSVSPGGAAHRPPPYVAASLRIPRNAPLIREDAHPPAYAHPPPPPAPPLLPPFATVPHTHSHPHPPSYEA